MDIPNAFIGRRKQPTSGELSAALGTSAGAWNEFVGWLAKEQNVVAQVWKSYSPKLGWSLQLKLKKRTIVHLAPCKGCFRIAFILGDSAVKAALQTDLPGAALEAIRSAPKYAEGTGVRFLVKSATDLPALKKLALIKLAN